MLLLIPFGRSESSSYKYIVLSVCGDCLGKNGVKLIELSHNS